MNTCKDVFQTFDHRALMWAFKAGEARAERNNFLNKARAFRSTAHMRVIYLKLALSCHRSYRRQMKWAAETLAEDIQFAKEV